MIANVHVPFRLAVVLKRLICWLTSRWDVLRFPQLWSLQLWVKTQFFHTSSLGSKMSDLFDHSTVTTVDIQSLQDSKFGASSVQRPLVPLIFFWMPHWHDFGFPQRQGSQGSHWTGRLRGSWSFHFGVSAMGAVIEGTSVTAEKAEKDIDNYIDSFLPSMGITIGCFLKVSCSTSTRIHQRVGSLQCQLLWYSLVCSMKYCLVSFLKIS